MSYFKYLAFRVFQFIRTGLLIFWLGYMLFNFLVLSVDGTYKNLQSLAIDKYDNLYVHIELKYQANNLKPATVREPFLAPSLVGKISQLLGFLTVATGFAFTLSSTMSILDEPTTRFISIAHGPGAIVIGRIVVLLFMVALLLSMFVRKKPLLAGFGQILAGSVIYFASLEQNVEIAAILIVISGLLAIISTFRRKIQIPSTVINN